MTIGERIKKRRLQLDMSQEELAEKCGYKSRSSINKIELARDLPLRKISLMAKALNTTETYLMGWDAEEEEMISNHPELFNVARSYAKKDLNLSRLLNAYYEMDSEQQTALSNLAVSMIKK